MELLFLNSSPRKDGNTATLLQSMTDTATTEGNSCRTVCLNDLQIRPCQGCGGCEKTGRCVIQDDMQGLYDLIDQADRVILASPIYFYALSAQLKICVDRLQAFWCRKYLLHRAAPAATQRKGYLVAVAATKGERIFEGAILTARYAIDAMGIAFGGHHCVRGMEAQNAVSRSSDTREAVREFTRTMLLH